MTIYVRTDGQQIPPVAMNSFRTNQELTMAPSCRNTSVFPLSAQLGHTRGTVDIHCLSLCTAAYTPCFHRSVAPHDFRANNLLLSAENAHTASHNLTVAVSPHPFSLISPFVWSRHGVTKRTSHPRGRDLRQSASFPKSPSRLPKLPNRDVES